MKEISKIYWSSFFQGLAAIASVTFTLFFLANHISQAEIGLLFSFFLISLAILEIPTGGFADTFGHRRSVMTGLLIYSFSFLIFFLGNSFFHFLVAMLLSALGLSFVSGALSSLVYDLLRIDNKLELYNKVQGRMLGYSIAAAVVAGPIGAFVFEKNIKFTMFMACIFSFIAACFIYMVDWEFKGKKPTVRIYFNKIFTGVNLALRNQRLMGIVLISIGLTTARMVFNQNMNQPYLLEIGISLVGIGIVASVVAVLAAFITLHTHIIFKKIGPLRALLVLIFIPAVCLFILSQTFVSYGALIILLFSVAHAFREPIMSAIGQKEVTDEQRSTMVSTVSFMVSIVVGLFFPLWGANIGAYGIRTVMIFLGVFTLVLGLCGVYLYKTAKH